MSCTAMMAGLAGMMCPLELIALWAEAYRVCGRAPFSKVLPGLPDYDSIACRADIYDYFPLALPR